MAPKTLISTTVLIGAIIAVVLLVTDNEKDYMIDIKPTVSITSPVFSSGGSIPSRYTCDGNDISPGLSILGIPIETKILVLIMDDPDSPTGTWDHWVLFNISPPGGSSWLIPEGQEPSGVSGKNSWGKLGYGGPCPGSGNHRYYFKIYALDMELALSEGSTKQEIEKEMEGHILAYGELMGRYERTKK